MNYDTWSDKTVYDGEDKEVGTVDSLYLDDVSDQPVWMTVKSSSLFGTKLHFAPVAGAKEVEDGIKLDVTKDEIKNAPAIDVDSELSEDDEASLYQHYSHQSDKAGITAGDEGQDASGPETDQAMTRSEEQLHVGKETHQTGVVRLKKYIITEDVHTTVPLQKEVVRLEREPITDENRDQAKDGAELSEEVHEMTLSEERAVVSKEVVPVERVKLSKDIVTQDTDVNETLQKEQIDYVDDK